MIKRCSSSTIYRKAKEGKIERKAKDEKEYLYKKSDVEDLDIKRSRRRW